MPATAESPIKKDNSTILISPLDPRLVIDEAKNTSRMGDPWGENSLQTMVDSLEKYGQQQDCKGYQDDDGKIHLIFGYGRALAGRVLAKKLPDWKLRIRLEKNISEDRAADANIVENYHRRVNNHADMADAAQKRLDAGYTKADVAALFCCSESLIDQVLPLNQLNKKHMDAIRSGDLLMSTALECLRFKDKVLRNKILDKIISESKRHGERLTSRQARKVIYDTHEEHEQENGHAADTSVEEQAEEQPKQNGRKRRADIPFFPRAVPDIKDFYQNLAASPIYPATVKAFGETMLKWTKGELGKPEKADQLLEEAIEKVFLDNPKGQKNENDEDVSEGWTT